MLLMHGKKCKKAYDNAGQHPNESEKLFDYSN